MLATKIEFLDGVQLEVFSEVPFTDAEVEIFRMLTSIEFKILVRIELGSGVTVH